MEEFVDRSRLQRLYSYSVRASEHAPLLWPWRLWAGPALVAFFVGLVAFQESLMEPLLGDEVVYERALDAVRRGAPLGGVVGWYYPDWTARLWAALGDVVTDHRVFQAMRLANLAGCAVVAAATTSAIHSRLTYLLAPLLLVFLPPFYIGIEVGNVSGLLVGLLVVASSVSSPWYRSLWLIPGFMLKPYSLAAVAERPIREALLPLLVAGAALVATSGRGSLVTIDASCNSSVIRAVHDFGVPMPWQLMTGFVLTVGWFWAREHWGRVFVVGWLSLPIAWDHTAILLFPPLAIALAAELALPRAETRTLRILIWLICALVVIQARYFGVERPSWLSGLLGLVPSIAALYLGSRCGRHSRSYAYDLAEAVTNNKTANNPPM